MSRLNNSFQGHDSLKRHINSDSDNLFLVCPSASKVVICLLFWPVLNCRDPASSTHSHSKSKFSTVESCELSVKINFPLHLHLKKFRFQTRKCSFLFQHYHVEYNYACKGFAILKAGLNKGHCSCFFLA